MILDTCALLWLASGDPRLSDSTRERIATAPNVEVSAISAFELGQKYNQGKLKLPTSPSKWFPSITDHYDITVEALSAEICLLATELPEIHKDPFDRLIIATAMTKGTPVITRDSIFERYGIEIIC